MAAASRARELILPLLFLPLAIPLVVGGVGASVSTEPARYLAFLGLYDAVFAILCVGVLRVRRRRIARPRRSPFQRSRPLAAGLVGLSIGLAFFVAPEDADQGISQRIFYFHVPIALTAYACFGWGAWKALRLLWKREERYDLESYVAIHQGMIFGTLTLTTGSIWAKASWGPGGCGTRTSSCSSSSSSSSTRRTSCCASRSRKARSVRTSPPSTRCSASP